MGRRGPNPCNHGLIIASPWIILLKIYWIPNIAYLDPIRLHDGLNNISQEQSSPTTSFLCFGNTEWNDSCCKDCSPIQTKLYPSHDKHGNFSWWSSWSIYERSSNNPIIMACVRILGRRQAPNPCNHGLTIASPWANLIKPHWVPNIAYLDPIGQHDEWNNISQEKPSPTTRFLWFGNIEWNDFCCKECSRTQTKIYPNHNKHGKLLLHLANYPQLLLNLANCCSISQTIR